jgi:hypothetical protein
VAYNCFCVPLPGSPTAKPFCAIGSAVNIQRQKIPRVLPGGASTRGSSQGEQLEGHHPKRDRDSRQTAISLRSCDAAATSPHRRCALCSRRGLGQSARVQAIKGRNTERQCSCVPLLRSPRVDGRGRPSICLSTATRGSSTPVVQGALIALGSKSANCGIDRFWHSSTVRVLDKFVSCREQTGLYWTQKPLKSYDAALRGRSRRRGGEALIYGRQENRNERSASGCGPAPILLEDRLCICDPGSARAS